VVHGQECRYNSQYAYQAPYALLSQNHEQHCLDSIGSLGDFERNIARTQVSSDWFVLDETNPFPQLNIQRDGNHFQGFEIPQERPPTTPSFEVGISSDSQTPESYWYVSPRDVLLNPNVQQPTLTVVPETTVEPQENSLWPPETPVKARRYSPLIRLLINPVRERIKHPLKATIFLGGVANSAAHLVESIAKR
jgi:hypothetical protein